MREAGAAQVNGLHEQMLNTGCRMADYSFYRARSPAAQGRGRNDALPVSAFKRPRGRTRLPRREHAARISRDTSLPPNAPPSDPWEADVELLAAVELDSIASEALFSDPDRLAVDIVSDGARARIRELDFSKLQ